MANITVPIQVNLPDDWMEQIVNRLRNDPESEWVEIVRCKECLSADWIPGTNRCYCMVNGYYWNEDDYCSFGERRTDDC